MKGNTTNNESRADRLMREEAEAQKREIRQSQKENLEAGGFWNNYTTWWVAGIIIIIAAFFVFWFWN